MSSHVEPLSTAMQIALRIPVVLISLAGVVVIVVRMRRIGGMSALFGAAGTLFIALDQLFGIGWTLHLSSISADRNLDSDELTRLVNLSVIADSVLITIGAALVVVALLARRPATATPPVFAPPVPAGYPSPPPHGPP